MSDVLDRLRASGLSLPVLTVPAANYVPFTCMGSLLFGAGLRLPARRPARPPNRIWPISSARTAPNMRLSPGAKVFTVEPHGFDKMARSLATGERLSSQRHAGSMMNALLAPAPDALTFDTLRRYGVRGLTVRDHEALGAMRAAFKHLKLVIEPGGAAALFKKAPVPGGTTLVIASGGNVGPAMFAKALA